MPALPKRLRINAQALFPSAVKASGAITLTKSNGVYTIGIDLSQISPSLVFGPGAGVTDNAIVRWDGTTGLLLQNSGIRIDDSGVLLAGDAGTSSFTFKTSSASVVPAIEAISTQIGGSSLGLGRWSASGPPRFCLFRSRGSSVGTLGLVSGGDSLGEIAWSADDGTGAFAVAEIRAEVDASTGAGDIATRMVFATSLDGTATPVGRMRIDNAGRLVIGGTGSQSVGLAAALQVHGTTQDTAAQIIARWSADSASLNLNLAKSRGASIGSQSIVSSGDAIADINWYASDGSGFQPAARIRVEIDATPGAGDMPGRMLFLTTPDGTTTLTERFRIDNAGLKHFTNGAFGYGFAGNGDGGTVTQATSKSTGVTLNTVTGQITMNNAALAASTSVSFTLTDNKIAANDILLIWHVSAGTLGSYTVTATPAAGSASITVRNVSLGSLSEAIVLAYAVLKAVVT